MEKSDCDVRAQIPIKPTMKLKLSPFTIAQILLILMGFLCGCAATPPSMRITVLTYNIHHSEDANGQSNLDAVASIINTFRPDLVALQEVDSKTTRVQGLDLAAELSQRTGMAGRFGKAMDYAGGEYGNAVLSRLPILAATTHPLPATAGVEPRAALETEIRLPDGRSLRFVSTHLDHQSNPENRKAQAARLRDLFADSPLPIILAGDLNDTPDSETLALLVGEWSDTGRTNPLPTCPADNPKRKIDYILFKPSDCWRIVETRVVDEKVASDHRPVLAVLELLPN